MKILEFGKYVNITCPICGAKLHVEKEDWESPRGSGFNKTFVACPVCKGLIYENELMKRLNDELKPKLENDDNRSNSTNSLILEDNFSNSNIDM